MPQARRGANDRSRWPTGGAWTWASAAEHGGGAWANDGRERAPLRSTWILLSGGAPQQRHVGGRVGAGLERDGDSAQRDAFGPFHYVEAGTCVYITGQEPAVLYVRAVHAGAGVVAGGAAASVSAMRAWYGFDGGGGDPFDQQHTSIERMNYFILGEYNASCC